MNKFLNVYNYHSYRDREAGSCVLHTHVERTVCDLSEAGHAHVNSLTWTPMQQVVLLFYFQMSNLLKVVQPQGGRAVISVQAVRFWVLAPTR